MKKYIPYIIIAALLVVISLLWKKEPKIIYSNFEIPVSPFQNNWQDKNGNNHTVMPAALENRISKKELRNPDRPSTIVDTSAKVLKLALKQIEFVVQENVRLRAENLKLAQTKTPEGKIVYTYSDPNIQAKFTPPSDSSSTDGTLDFLYNADINTTQYWKRTPPIIGAKKSFLDIYSNDKRLTINGKKRYTVEQNAPEFGLRLQLRAIYGITSQKLYTGPGISFDFKRYNFLAYSYYNLTDNKWQYAVGVNYDLIRF